MTDTKGSRLPVSPVAMSNGRIAVAPPRDGIVEIDTAPHVFHAILRRDVSLAIWDRPPPFAVPDYALDDFPSMNFTATCDAVAATAQAVLGEGASWQSALAADAGMLALRFGEVMGTDRLDVRIEHVSGNACWKVHADYVTARLITTLSGRGTEWFGAATDRNPAPIPRGQLKTGAVGLFKGRDWAPDTAILHRSPPIAGTGEQRLLLVMDPARA